MRPPALTANQRPERAPPFGPTVAPELAVVPMRTLLHWLSGGAVEPRGAGHAVVSDARDAMAVHAQFTGMTADRPPAAVTSAGVDPDALKAVEVTQNWVVSDTWTLPQRHVRLRRPSFSVSPELAAPTTSETDWQYRTSGQPSVAPEPPASAPPADELLPSELPADERPSGERSASEPPNSEPSPPEPEPDVALAVDEALVVEAAVSMPTKTEAEESFAQWHAEHAAEPEPVPTDPRPEPHVVSETIAASDAAAIVDQPEAVIASTGQDVDHLVADPEPPTPSERRDQTFIAPDAASDLASRPSPRLVDPPDIGFAAVGDRYQPAATEWEPVPDAPRGRRWILGAAGLVAAAVAGTVWALSAGPSLPPAKVAAVVSGPLFTADAPIAGTISQQLAAAGAKLAPQAGLFVVVPDFDEEHLTILSQHLAEARQHARETDTRVSNLTSAAALAHSKPAAQSVERLMQQAQADNTAALADVDRLEHEVSAQIRRPDPVVVRSTKPVLVNRFMAGTGRTVAAGTPIVQLADCGALVVIVDAVQAAVAGFAGGQTVTVGFAGSDKTVSMHLPPKLPVTGQLVLKLDSGAIQSASGDACPLGHAATVTAG